LPPFSQLLTDDDREKKAERSSPGTYHVLVNPDSFAHLPEYSDDSDAKRERSLPVRRPSIAPSLASSLGQGSEGIPFPSDPNIVLLPRFEDTAKRLTGKEPPSPTLVRVKTEEQPSEEAYLTQFKEVVWKHLVPVEVSQLDGNCRSSAAIIEQESLSFPPVSPYKQCDRRYADLIDSFNMQ
jgi:hypothetical protein